MLQQPVSRIILRNVCILLMLLVLSGNRNGNYSFIIAHDFSTNNVDDKTVPVRFQSKLIHGIHLILESPLLSKYFYSHYNLC